MRVFHGTTPQLARQFARDGIDAHLTFRRAIHGPQDGVPGIYVTPKLSVARRFGLCVLAIEVPEDQLAVPPNLRVDGVTLQRALSHNFEPQAFLSSRVEPSAICVAECHENGYPFNPFDRDD
jgi:hypothetical protein